MDASIDKSEDAAQQSPLARQEVMAEVRSWGYQLQSLNVSSAAGAAVDLLVVDEEFEGRKPTERRSDILRTLKRKPDGRRRLVLAYLSIGEAEDYRRYWDRRWVAPAPPRPGTAHTGAVGTPAKSTSKPVLTAQPATPVVRPLMAPTSAAPAWLGDENDGWRGNFRVRFWDPSWQALMFGNETAALERLVGAGFDGVYLDRADVYQRWARDRPQARSDMEDFIQRLAARAHELSPGFVVVMQNAEELLGSNKIRGALDAVAKEDLLFGIDGDERPNKAADIEASLRLLKKAQRAGLPVLAVEYLSDEKKLAAARNQLTGNGFLPYFAPRALDRLRTAD